MAFSSKGHTQTALAEINITPLVDVVLVLLLIFMLTAPVLQSGVEVAIPKTRTVNQLTEERMVVTIDREQNVFLQDKPVNVNQLPALLKVPRNADAAKRIIYLRADERVPFGAFASVMDAVKQAGITNISIVTQPIEASEEGAIAAHLQLGRDDSTTATSSASTSPARLCCTVWSLRSSSDGRSSSITRPATGAKTHRTPEPSRPPWSRRFLCPRRSARSTPAS